MAHSDYEVRRFLVRDRKFVYDLMKILCEDLGEKFLVSEAAFNTNSEYMMARPEEYIQYVATSGSMSDSYRPIGYLSIVCYRTNLHETGTALINELVVHPDFRRKGIGAALIAKAFVQDEELASAIQKGFEAKDAKIAGVEAEMEVIKGKYGDAEQVSDDSQPAEVEKGLSPAEQMKANMQADLAK